MSRRSIKLIAAMKAIEAEAEETTVWRNFCSLPDEPVSFTEPNRQSTVWRQDFSGNVWRGVLSALPTDVLDDDTLLL